MGLEEQAEEREVLKSIFPDEITNISPAEFRISITLDIPDDKDEAPVMLLTVRYPEPYPDELPILDLSAPPNAPSHPLFSVSHDRDKLQRDLQATAEENLGMPMVFTLVSTLKEAAEQLAVERRDEALRVREEALLAAEREENKKFHGTPVTRETFLRWRDGFMQEMEEARQREEDERAAEAKRSRVKEPVRLTGRELWEGGLAGKSDQEEGDDDDVPAEGLGRLKVGD